MRTGLQTVEVDTGFAYAAIGADAEVFAGGVPMFVLENWRAGPEPDTAWLRAVPSRMLDSRNAVVEFQGRTPELAGLHRWLSSPPRLAGRWLHGPGGAGKTRLAARFAEQAAARGWKVVTAVYGPGTVHVPRGSQDLRTDGAAGLLVLVDYADRWPLSHLRRLVGNSLLNQFGVPTRVLFLGRSDEGLPGLREAGADASWLTGEALAPLPTGREQMFRAARDSFATRFGIEAPDAVGTPSNLDEPEMGLTLAVHLAALVAVDAYVSGRRAGGSVADLTIYLLDREQEQWSTYDFRTSPAMMTRAVHAAALTGPVEHADGAKVLRRAGLPGDPEQTLRDHAVCYPPAVPGAVLEPLYPDRLAEDFLALTMPGHAESYPAQPWAESATTAVLESGTARGVISLTAAAARWEHLRHGFFYPLLSRRPRLAVGAGSPALIGLASIPEVPLGLLEAIEGALPPHRDVDLDAGIAAISVVLTRHRIAATTDPAVRAGVHLEHARRLTNAGRHQEGLRSARSAVALYEQVGRSADLAGALITLAACLAAVGRPASALVAADRAAAAAGSAIERAGAENAAAVILARLGRFREALRRARRSVRLHRDPVALSNLGARLWDLGRSAEALTVAAEAAEMRRSRPEDRPGLAAALTNLAVMLASSGRRVEALAVQQEAAAIYEQLARVNPGAFRPGRAAALNNVGVLLAQLGRPDEALSPSREAVAARRRLVEENSAAHLPDLIAPLDNLSFVLAALGSRAEALKAAAEATEINRRLAGADPTAYQAALAVSLTNESIRLHELGRTAEAAAVAQESVDLLRKTRGDQADLARSLHNLAVMLPDGLPAAEEAVARRRKLAAADPDAHRPDLAASLTLLGGLLETGGETPLREACDLYDRLVREGRRDLLGDLGGARQNLAVALSEAGQDAEAVTVAEQAVEITREVAGSGLDGDRAALADALNNLAFLQARQGLVSIAEAAAEEAGEIYRELVRRHPGLYEDGLAEVEDTAREMRS